MLSLEFVHSVDIIVRIFVVYASYGLSQSGPFYLFFLARIEFVVFFFVRCR